MSSTDIYLAVDIETVANEKAMEIIANVDVKFGNTKDDAKKEEKRKEVLEKEYERCALHWTTGKIVHIGAKQMEPGTVSWHSEGEDEKALLEGFMKYLDVIQGKGNLIIFGKNYTDFDRPFIIGRCLVHKVRIHPFLKVHTMGFIEDVDHIFSKSARCQQTDKLNNYARALGIPCKTGNGADVQRLWDEKLLGLPGSEKTIEDYNERDLEITMEIMRRYQA